MILHHDKCPKCDRIFIDKEEATRHSNIPLDIPLPLGFVYACGKGDVYWIIGDEGALATGERFALWIENPTPHTFNHSVFNYTQNEENSIFTGSPYFINTKRIKTGLRCGVNRILTSTEFDYFSKNFSVERIEDYENFPQEFSIDKFVRTTPELNKLVEERQEYLRKIHEID